MKIRITSEVAVSEYVRPRIGSIHDVLRVETAPCGKLLYFIRVGSYGGQIGVKETECEVLEDGGEDWEWTLS